MQTRLRVWKPGLMLLAILVSSMAGSTGALAQKVEVGVYGGGSFFSRPSFTSTSITPQILVPSFTATSINGLFVGRVEYDLAAGGVFGVRVRENLTDRFGLEQSWTFTGTNNGIFPGYVVVGTRMHQLYFNGNINAFTSERKVRPYFSAGLGWSSFNPTDEGKADWANQFVQFSEFHPIDSDTEMNLNFGAGVKARLTRLLSLDFSLRDFVQRSPTYNIPNPTDRDLDNNTQVQAGILFNFGGNRPLIVHSFAVAPTIEAGNTSLCPGDSSTLQISASDSIPNNRVTYRWTVNGQEVSVGPEYTFVAPRQAGAYDTAVRVFYDDSQLDKSERKAVAKNPGAPADRRITMNVGVYQPPTAVASMDRTTVQRGDRVRFTSNATGSACSGNLVHRWTANDGRIAASSDGLSADFESSTLAFSDSIQGQQCKPVRVSLAVTDQRGGTAADAKDIQVCYTAAVARTPPPPPKPTAIQLSDINFATNSARVNNCAKRILANDLYPQLTDARYRNYDVLLVGHRDGAEVEKIGKAAPSPLDRQRVLNAASFLSAGGASCKDIELSRVKVSWAATDQNNEFKSNFCDASTQERRKDTVSSADAKARNRRVEIWLVPRDASLPSGIGTTPTTPDVNISCPR